MEQIIRLLRADEIECRVSTIGDNGLSLLLYKDARVDQKILDETFGIFGWQKYYESIDGNLYATVEILDRSTGTWIGKQDVGTTGYTEKEKSQASDAFKRACFNWGIGRELYSAPFIWIPAKKCSMERKGDRLYTKDRFSVSSIEYSAEREIKGLVIVNDKGEEVFKYAVQKKENKLEKRNSPNKDSSEKLSLEQIKALDSELERTGVTMDEVSARYEIGSNKSDISPEIYKRIMASLKKTRSAA